MNKDKTISRVTLIGLLSNVSIGILKVVFGALANSITIIGNGIDNFQDTIASFISWFGMKEANKPPDKDHPFGHRRMEYISSLIIATLILAIGITLCFESISSLFESKGSKIEVITLIILGSTIIIKILQGLMYLYYYKKLKVMVLKVSLSDSFIDAGVTFIILICMFINMNISFDLDGYLSIIMSIFIIYTGVKLIIEASKPLIGEKENKLFVDSVLKDIKSNENVLGVHDVLVHSYGKEHIFMSVHVELNSSLDFVNVHNIVDDIEEKIAKKYHISLITHPDPIDINDIETENIRILLRNIGAEIQLECHDIRIVPGEKKKLIFEIALNYDYPKSKTQIIEHFKKHLNKDYEMVINFENLYY
ncbi:MAG: cation diffusion facilitator family transporter [Bacillales bacterium]|jgi:cation diffusion facilitator family transporter|nr:cation diffusion facilitator family transporter [Bacillales bacterium]